MEPRLISSNDYSLEEKISFFELANVRFGIDFSSWEQAGEWNRHYTCYSYTGEEKILSNVGLHEMTLLIDDVPTPAYQIDDTVVVYTIDGTSLHLYAVLTQQLIHWEKIIERLSFKGVTEIIFEFTPDLDVLIRDSTDGNWMVRTSTFPLWPPTLRFPTLSRT